MLATISTSIGRRAPEQADSLQVVAGAQACLCLHACMQAVRYGQLVQLDGYELTAQAFPSGSGLGHALWLISDSSRRCV